jgi:hypothetical protein
VLREQLLGHWQRRELQAQGKLSYLAQKMTARGRNKPEEG